MSFTLSRNVLSVKHSAHFKFTTLLYFASNFFKFWRIVLSSVSNIFNTKAFFIYPYFITIFYNFNVIFSMLLLWIEKMCLFYTYTKKAKFFQAGKSHKLFTSSLCFLNWHYSFSYFLVFHWHCSHSFSSSHIFFLPNNRIKFFMTYFHVNQCLGY